MRPKPSATTAPSPSRSTVGEQRAWGIKVLGGRDRTEGVIIAAMVVLVIVQAALLVRMMVA